MVFSDAASSTWRRLLAQEMRNKGERVRKVTEWRWGAEKAEGRWRRRGPRRRLLRGRVCGGGLLLAARTGVGVDAEKGREGRSLIPQIGEGRRSRRRIRVLVKR
ncbi:unnamed protein product [Linum trigynum]|uniref:Uncharacterized protein n=1 Tax=Linum trigynum TaxID=586398 RepID=A0AAV2EQ68_9ROSI